MRALDILSSRQESKRYQNSMPDVKIRNKMKVELLALLGSVLEENDKVLIEINPKYLPDFIEVLDDPSLAIYRSVQVEQDKFEFSNKELII